MATILVTHGIPAEGFSLLSGEKIVIPKPLMQFSTDELAALIPAADAVVACGALPGEIIRRGRLFSPILRETASISPMASSAVLSVTVSGRFVTGMPHSAAARTSTPS